MRRLISLFGICLGLGWAANAEAGTCALCREVLASGGSDGLIEGIYWSILLIAGMPLILMTTIGIAVWRYRRARH